MQKICSQCGILNREFDVTCYRCKSPISNSYKTGLKISDSSKSSFSLVRLIIVLVVALSLGFAVYKKLDDSTATGKQTLNNDKAFQIFANSQKEDAERIKNQREREDSKKLEQTRQDEIRQAHRKNINSQVCGFGSFYYDKDGFRQEGCKPNL